MPSLVCLLVTVTISIIRVTFGYGFLREAIYLLEIHEVMLWDIPSMISTPVSVHYFC